ncbi:hypothetical protein GIY23_14925 [Allosaccharopolyspora coralli]|uniref:Uncharacterized protein n=1 Tax=Allosaccharopolyspora coralli TaxID=2665642 RepID=A0A5Q3QBN2_9PSEU|nr:hypothetical protein [Allosaccharopolyspora coralli]QGK70634.1 hypothetical protein GIY23_14925 [Allosaccharopolyspora coralli]
MLQGDLDKLFAIARMDGSADEVWPAAAAAIDVLWWQERFAAVRALAEETIFRFHDTPGTLFDHHIPFSEAVLIGAAASGDEPKSALARVSEVVPAGTVLGTRLNWLEGKLWERPPHSLVTGLDTDLYSPLRPKSLRTVDAELADRDPVGLTTSEQLELWGAARRCSEPHIAFRLYDSGFPPFEWPTVFWLARQLIKFDRTRDATAALLESLHLWGSEEPWHVAPNGVMLQPDMREAVTPELRDAVLAAVDISQVPGVRS